MRHHRYEKRGLLAVDPKAFLEVFVEVPSRENISAQNVEIVTIDGPLDQHAGWWGDSYDEILERVDVACASSAPTVVLKIDSPGGAVSGLFDTTRALRAKCKAADKRLVAFVDCQACSAAYALACAADEIVVSETAMVGSVGVVDARLDVTAADAAMGMRFAFVASGARKVDGHPHVAITEAELAETQAKVDQLAGMFFDLVAERRGKSTDAIEGLEARVFHGQKAVDSGLADRVQPYGQLLAALAADGGIMTEKKEETEASAEQKASDFTDALESLRKAAEGDGEEADKARRALEVLEGGDDDDEEDAAASKEQHDEDDNPRAETAAAAARPSGVQASTATDLAATVQAQGQALAQIQRELEATKRDQLLASRPDLERSLVKVLRSKPLADVQAIVNAIPKPKAPKTAATATVNATRGEGQGGPAKPTSEQSAELDRRMGLAASSGGMRRERSGAVFNVMSPEQAQKRFAELNGGAK